MEFQDYLKTNAKKVEEDLENILSDFYKDTKKTNPKLIPFAKKFVESCKGGKRIRGVLCNLGYEIAKTSDKRQVTRDKNEILKIGAAFEILHTALLIHDDIIDESLKRRDKPSLYVSLGNNHYGISQAITLGDIALYLPIKIITETKFESNIKIKVLNYFSKILINTGWGQVMDVQNNYSDREFINLYKTAKYTIAGPLQIGAMLGGLSPASLKLRRISEFGENLGIAFQLQDDILDKETKDIRKTRMKAVEYAIKARKMIPLITKDEKMSKLLENMCDYMVERSK